MSIEFTFFWVNHYSIDIRLVRFHFDWFDSIILTKIKFQSKTFLKKMLILYDFCSVLLADTRTVLKLGMFVRLLLICFYCGPNSWPHSGASAPPCRKILILSSMRVHDTKNRILAGLNLGKENKNLKRRRVLRGPGVKARKTLQIEANRTEIKVNQITIEVDRINQTSIEFTIFLV